LRGSITVLVLKGARRTEAQRVLRREARGARRRRTLYRHEAHFYAKLLPNQYQNTILTNKLNNDVIEVIRDRYNFEKQHK